MIVRPIAIAEAEEADPSTDESTVFTDGKAVSPTLPPVMGVPSAAMVYALSGQHSWYCIARGEGKVGTECHRVANRDSLRVVRHYTCSFRRVSRTRPLLYMLM